MTAAALVLAFMAFRATISKSYSYASFGSYMAVAFLIIYFAKTLPVIFIGAFVVGTSIGFEMPGTLLYATNYNTVAAATAGCAVIHMAGQLGTVCSALFYTPVSGLIKPNDTSFRFLFAAICCAVFAVLTAVAVSFIRKSKKAA